MCFDLKEGSSSYEGGGDTLVGRGCILISRGRLLNGIYIVGVAHFYACTNPLTLLIFSLRAMCWYHDSTERVLGSKLLENELLWTSVNVLVVSPVVQKVK